MKNSVSTIKNIIFVILALALATPLVSIITGYSAGLSAFSSETGLGRSYPAVVFITNTLTLIMAVILIFTPGEKTLSPLNHFATELASKLHLYLNYTDSNTEKRGFDERSAVLSSVLIDLVILGVLTITYYFILRKVNQPDISYLYMLFYLFFIYVIISVNSFVTMLIWRAEMSLREGGSGMDSVTYVQKKNIYTVVLILSTIFILTAGEAVSKSWATSVASKDLPIINWFTTTISDAKSK